MHTPTLPRPHSLPHMVPAAPAWRQWLAARLRSLRTRYATYRRHRRESAQLSAMSARELRDIGLSRSDANALRDEGFVGSARHGELMADRRP